MSDIQLRDNLADWSSCKLGEHAAVRGRIGWKGLTSEEYTDEGPYLVAGNHILGDKIQWDKCQHINQFRYEESPEIKLEVGDIIISKDGTIGRAAYVDGLPGPTTINSTMMLIRVAVGRGLEPRYVFYCLQGDVFQRLVAERVSGSGVPHLFQADMKELEILMPDAKEQHKIAKILSTVDNIIEKTQALIDKYQSIKQGMMHDLFTRGVEKNGHLRPSYEEAPHLYKESELGWIPEEWEIVSIESLLADVSCPMRSGPFGSSLLKSELVERGIPFLGIDNIHREHFCREYKRFVSTPKFIELNQYRVRPLDLMITIMGTVGRACVVPEDVGDALSSKHVWTMTFDENNYLPDLLSWQFNFSAWVLSWFRRDGQGAVMDSITSSTLRKTKIPKPPFCEQLSMKNKYVSASKRVNDERAYLEKLKLLKVGLMQDLLTGKVRVKVDV